MPPSDQEPRYQLVDSNGNVVGSLFGDGSGNVVIADETDTQTTFDANGITTPALEADSGTVDNKQIAGIGASSDGDLSFGDWEQVSATRPAIVIIRARVRTDGVGNADVLINVDESGGTTADYSLPAAKITNDFDPGQAVEDVVTVPLKPGAQYQVVNNRDPDNANTVELERIFEL